MAGGKRGRPALLAEGWPFLQIMHGHVNESGMSENAAAERVVRDHYRKMPTTGTRASAVRWLKKHYPRHRARLGAPALRFPALRLPTLVLFPPETRRGFAQVAERWAETQRALALAFRKSFAPPPPRE